MPQNLLTKFRLIALSARLGLFFLGFGIGSVIPGSQAETASLAQQSSNSSTDWSSILLAIGGSALTGAFMSQRQHYEQETEIKMLKMHVKHNKEAIAVENSQISAQISQLLAELKAFDEASQNRDRYLSSRLIDAESFLQINHGYQRRRTLPPVNSGFKDDPPTGGWVG